MDQAKFVEDSRPYPFKFFKGCLPQILLGPFLNTLSHIDPQLPNPQFIITITKGINDNMLELVLLVRG